jgi:hypothetical protein
MAKLIEKRRVSCQIKHIGALIVRYDDESFAVKCVNIKTCGETCPYLKNPDFRSAFTRTPEYKPKL